jgi:predicted metalloendopeptidase
MDSMTTRLQSSYIHTYIHTYIHPYRSHGFDDNGAQYNARGELEDWWSNETVTAFKTQSTCIADLFSSYSIDSR